MSALQGQVGGTHYRDMGMQPFEYTMANRWDALAHTILKYVSRHHVKNGKQDLLKALHCCHLRVELGVKYPPHMPMPMVRMGVFVTSNGIPPEEEYALAALENWVCRPHHGPDETIRAIEYLIAHRYP